jgi:hypothetical protein
MASPQMRTTGYAFVRGAQNKKPAPNKKDLSGLSCPMRADFLIDWCQEREQSPGYGRSAPIVTYFTEDSIGVVDGQPR